MALWPRMALVAALVLALGAGGCGRDKAAPSSQGDSASPEKVVRAYVEALNQRDGRHFCHVVAPYISGQYELFGRDPEGLFKGRKGCPSIVSTFVGYIEDCCPPKFLSASVRRLTVESARGDLLPVRMTLGVVQEDTATKRRHVIRLGDTVWLARFNGGWKVAKLSALAHRASLQMPGDHEDVLAPPDVAAQTRRFQREVAKQRSRLSSRRRSYRPAGAPADCSGGVVVKDPPGDLVDYRFPVPKTRPPRAEYLDLRRFTVRSRTGELCLAWETVAPTRGPAEFDFNLRDSAAGTHFIQIFTVELRRNGSSRVTSGVDQAQHPIPVPARVGRAGNQVTVVLDQRSFAHGKPTPTSSGRPPLDRFAFRAGVTGEVGRGRVRRDELGRGQPQRSYGYPDGEELLER